MAYDVDRTADAVRAGMEVLVWQVEEDHWNEIGLMSATRTQRRHKANTLGFMAAATSAVLLPAGLISATELDPVLALGTGGMLGLVLVPAIFFTVRGLILTTTRRTLGHDLPVVPIPPRVVITSTGILVGGHAWLWRAPSYRLTSAELQTGEPTKLCLKFRGTGLRRPLVTETVLLPFPSALDADLTELKELLDIKTQLTG